ncbi:hypothetical protein CEXT_26221 [Caerostris extrusa]|uniref:Uncharacterized protein n=1 Tax=Caerostris extrusa TaxID=172846 RepID=A0AAV4WCQ6_CAEEX|nr:hypothetical protein CEXT_26221 [Caerostris extrusa]
MTNMWRVRAETWHYGFSGRMPTLPTPPLNKNHGSREHFPNGSRDLLPCPMTQNDWRSRSSFFSLFFPLLVPFPFQAAAIQVDVLFFSVVQGRFRIDRSDKRGKEQRTGSAPT